jgi:leader peptidase (prepilin peptidase)/N-methyltransferase
VIPFIVGAFGFVLGLVSHDLAVDGLTDERPLRPLLGSCPRCGTARGWLSARCPNCSRTIEREPIVALASAGVAVGFWNTFGLEWVLLAYMGFLVLTTALVVTDLEEFRIVDRLNLRGSLILGVLLGISAATTGDFDSLLRGLLGAAAYFGGATLLWLLVRGRGFGAGDVKLAPVLGLYTAYISWDVLGQAVFATAMIGGVVAVALIALGRAGMKTELPYGPPMVLGAWLAIILAGL